MFDFREQKETKEELVLWDLQVHREIQVTQVLLVHLPQVKSLSNLNLLTILI